MPDIRLGGVQFLDPHQVTLARAGLGDKQAQAALTDVPEPVATAAAPPVPHWPKTREQKARRAKEQAGRKQRRRVKSG